MEEFQKEMEGNGKREIEGNQLKLDHIWGQQMVKVCCYNIAYSF
jgi:hypothetical protein